MKKYLLLAFVFLTSCAGSCRGCSSEYAEKFGADWIVVKENVITGEPVRCWKLESVSITNEPNSDGIYWKDSQGHLVHISGNYDRIQVNNKHWDEAATTLGVNLNNCRNGFYKND